MTKSLEKLHKKVGKSHRKVQKKPSTKDFLEIIWSFAQNPLSLHSNLNKILGLVAQLVRATDS